jgi:glycosyltransferase 2 family protein
VTSSTARTAVLKLGRNWLGVALSLLIAACVGAALWHLLRDIDAGKVIAAFIAQPIRNIVIAGVFVVLGYVTLTFYDVFALHIIGRRTIPFHVAALASFTSYTIGHSLGAATLTGAVVRLRVYSPGA